MKSGRRDRRVPLLLALLLVTCLAIYSGSLHGPYVLDDIPNLVANPYLILHHLSWDGIRSAAMSSNAGPLHRPISMLSFALNYSLAGDKDPFSAKLVNVLLHLMVGACIFLLTRRLLPFLKTFGGTTLQGVDADGAALLTTAIWLLHPLFVSTVLYTVQRMTILSALFMVLGCLFYLEFRRRQFEENGGSIALIAGMAAFTLLAVLSKENGALLPGLLLLLEFFTYRFRKAAVTSRAGHGLLLAGLVIPTMFIPCYLAVYFALHWDLQASSQPFLVYQRFLTEFRVVLQYAGWLLFAGGEPMGLYHDDIPVSRSIVDPPTTLICALILLAAFVLSGVFARRRHVVSFGLLWFFWGQILESTVVPLLPAFEHRNYLPGLGLLLCLGTAAYQVSMRPGIRPVLRFSLLSLILIIPGWQLEQRVSVWANESDFLVHALKTHPNSPLVLLYVAQYVGSRGKYSDALEALHRAARLDPQENSFPLAELALRCKYAPRRPLPGALGKRLLAMSHTARWSPTAHLAFTIAVKLCIPTSTNDGLLLRLYHSLQPRSDSTFGMYSLLGEANVYAHRHDYRKAMAAWDRAVANYPHAKELKPDLEKLRAVLRREGKIPVKQLPPVTTTVP